MHWQLIQNPMQQGMLQNAWTLEQSCNQEQNICDESFSNCKFGRISRAVPINQMCAMGTNKICVVAAIAMIVFALCEHLVCHQFICCDKIEQQKVELCIWINAKFISPGENLFFECESHHEERKLKQAASDSGRHASSGTVICVFDHFFTVPQQKLQAFWVVCKWKL